MSSVEYTGSQSIGHTSNWQFVRLSETYVTKRNTAHQCYRNNNADMLEMAITRTLRRNVPLECRTCQKKIGIKIIINTERPGRNALSETKVSTRLASILLSIALHCIVWTAESLWSIPRYGTPFTVKHIITEHWMFEKQRLGARVSRRPSTRTRSTSAGSLTS